MVRGGLGLGSSPPLAFSLLFLFLPGPAPSAEPLPAHLLLVPLLTTGFQTPPALTPGLTESQHISVRSSSRDQLVQTPLGSWRGRGLGDRRRAQGHSGLSHFICSYLCPKYKHHKQKRETRMKEQALKTVVGSLSPHACRTKDALIYYSLSSCISPFSDHHGRQPLITCK